ncbi:MAG: DUF429 domain-containing protein [Cellvibrionales bacterium]|nr:DUF429 domain-containing protein [Cellvibrionales bacterium]
MKILGIDFTSSSKKRKPITCAHCLLDGGTLRFSKMEEWSEFEGFENALRRPGPWIAGIDFPFGQADRFIKNIGWPQDWAGYVRHARGLGKEGFCNALNEYRKSRPKRDKEHLRRTDKPAGSVSPQKLYFVPVGQMFFAGAPHLLDARVSVPGLLRGNPKRVVVEAYPGVLARSVIGKKSYKHDTKKKQTGEQHQARLGILNALRNGAAREHYEFDLDAPDCLCEDPGGDHLDALLCAIQAAWAWKNKENGHGMPKHCGNEGWIADPHCVHIDS